ncbi:MAG: heme-binding protein [Halobacteriaceae archaeon]
MPEAPPTAEGWYVLHDFRTVDWDAWRDAPDHVRETATEEGVAYLDRHEAVQDADAGDSATFAVLGHSADLLLLHLRPTVEALDRASRQFERTRLAAFTDRVDSYVSVTEVSGYVSDDYFQNPDDVDDGTRRYIENKLTPEVPDADYLSFYPMSKRRDPEYNWYALDFEERASMMAEHGESGRSYAGRVKQIVASSVAFEDHEWSVTLFSDDPTDLKDVVYEMRFDEASAKYAEFGDFELARRFPPADLPAYLAGETVPSGAAEATGPEQPAQAGGAGDQTDGDHPSTADEAEPASAGGPPSTGDRASSATEIREALADLDVYAGQPHGEDVYALVLYSGADPDTLAEEVATLRDSFDHYDTHVRTAVYEPVGADDPDRTAVASIWETAGAADTASGFLSDLPGVVDRAGEGDGWGTMGMFYTVDPERRDDFVEKFDEVTDLLADTEGHRETTLLANRTEDNDMFIASEWRSKDDAMSFFGSDAFGETVSWGRDVLVDRPRHVFLA